MSTGARRRLVALLLTALTVGALAWAVRIEIESSPLQSRLLTRLTSDFQVTVALGPNDRLPYPESGPFDERRGYTQIPRFLWRLEGAGYAVERQARLSPRLQAFIARGGFPIYREKSQGGLTIHDRSGDPVYQARHPERVFGDFARIPPLIAATLTFIEDQDLLDLSIPSRNPAVEWDRLAAAGLNALVSAVVPTGQRFGGSTLAVQLEKFRHSPGGRTDSPAEKLRQVVSASARAYAGGPDTTEARRRILTDYLDSTPLSARAGYGEVIGLGDGLHVWFGTELDEAIERLREPQAAIAISARSAGIYKQVLSLLLAQRQPSYYLLRGREELSALTETYLDLLADGGIIGDALRGAAAAQPLQVRGSAPAPASESFLEQKALNAIRTNLLSLLGIDSLYDLDRLDLRVEATLDMTAQRNTTEALRRFGVPKLARREGLYGKHLLRRDPAGIAYSVTLYERAPGANLVRVQADNVDRPLDLNEGGMLDLGSTAKLRTLATYLEIIAELHQRYAVASDAVLKRVAKGRVDPLTSWTAEYLRRAEDRSLTPMLEAAMERRYPGYPATFFTGRGQHSFGNADKTHNRVLSVRDAFRVSANLVFIRLMRDLVAYYQATEPEPIAEILADRAHPARARYLERFADAEGQVFVKRAYRRYRKLAPDEALALLADRAKPGAHRLATLFRSVRPEEPVDAFNRFARERLGKATPPEGELAELYHAYGPDRYDLQDRGYITGLHPLELTVVRHLQRNPEATRGEVVAATAGERQAVYGWLFKPNRKAAADRRIRMIAEEDAFKRLHASWQRQGYPFGSLVPSLATAIGSSADRPAALAELIGIIVNDGWRLPTIHVERIHLAEGTPFETHLGQSGEGVERVFPKEITRILRRSLEDVVAGGTARRLSGVYTDSSHQPFPVGGKTGTGDELIERYGPGTAAGKRKEVSRSAAFAFFLGERFFGVITAHVPGVNEEGHRFTSALPTQVLKALEPILRPMLRDKPSQLIEWDEAIAEASGNGGARQTRFEGAGADSGSRGIRSVRQRVSTGARAQSKGSGGTGGKPVRRRPPRVVDDLF
jgi:membrane peptidoglycan carboxypeptidase